MKSIVTKRREEKRRESGEGPSLLLAGTPMWGKKWLFAATADRFEVRPLCVRSGPFFDESRRSPRRVSVVSNVSVYRLVKIHACLKARVSNTTLQVFQCI